MKSAYGKLAVTIPFIVLALFVTVAVGLSGRAERVQAAAALQQQPEQQLYAGSCDNLLNSLFTAGR